MSLWDRIFGGGDSGSNVTNQYLSQIPGMERKELGPFIEPGKTAGPILSEQFGQMAQDPTSIINAIMGQYQPSQGYQFEKGELQRALSNTAAAGGMRGTPFEQEQQGKLVQGLLSQDMQDWLRNVLGVQQAGLAGEQGLFGTGAGVAQGMASDLANVLGQQAQYAFQGNQARQQRGSDLLSGVLGLAGNVLGGFL